ncbi:MAG TPA: hypothetical protein PLK90_08400 [Clostridiales bacterium]|nr:hypothetical protein [Clostridiales bacterium]HQP70402.1 hypothetical protein [Clostridiales bacterium]
MEKINCKKCSATIATPGYASRTFAGTYMTCSQCGTELKKVSYILKLSEVQVAFVCKKCIAIIKKRTGLKCPICGTIN